MPATPTAPLITLLTDFGTKDHYVAAMKGVMLEICPEARLVDISHEIPPCEIAEACYTLAQAWPCFPSGTIHLAVVDPGVGSSRRPIVVEAGGHVFVGPDNGVFTMAAEARAFHITVSRYFRHPVSRTFHGRDVFAPVAAHLARGVAPAEFGPEIHDRVCLACTKPVPVSAAAWTGAILHVDRFGNVVTNLDSKSFDWVTHEPFEIRMGRGCVSEYSDCYDATPAGTPFAIAGSAGFLEISINQQSAAQRFGVRAGDAIELRRVIR